MTVAMMVKMTVAMMVKMRAVMKDSARTPTTEQQIHMVTTARSTLKTKNSALTSSMTAISTQKKCAAHVVADPQEEMVVTMTKMTTTMSCQNLMRMKRKTMVSA